MNWILIETHELDAAGEVSLADERARHALAWLRAEPGRRLRIGLLDGPLGEGEVLACADGVVRLRCHWGAPPVPAPDVTLLLAPPRPKTQRRLWSALACLGVRRIVLLNAARVERSYFDAHGLIPAEARRHLLEGLAQAGDTRLPAIEIRSRFKPFVEDELDALAGAGARWLGDAGRGPHPLDTPTPSGARVTLAVGPEGGWTEYERDALLARGFSPVSLGPRVLRSDVAAVALVTCAQAVLRGAHADALNLSGRG